MEFCHSEEMSWIHRIFRCTSLLRTLPQTPPPQDHRQKASVPPIPDLIRPFALTVRATAPTLAEATFIVPPRTDANQGGLSDAQVTMG
jgi:hypothetical protein